MLQPGQKGIRRHDFDASAAAPGRPALPISVRLDRWLLEMAEPQHVDEPLLEKRLRAFVDLGLDAFPLPGGGSTLLRWQLLSRLAAEELCFAKLVEAHTDALAILAELGHERPAGASIGIWASEPPDARLQFEADSRGGYRIFGRKSWCSGAGALSHALVTGWNVDGEQCLALVALRQPGIRITGAGWEAVGMAATRSVDVVFDNAQGERVGRPGAYAGRPGFWHGAGGIAACWHGAATAIAETLRRQVEARPEPHACAHLGSVDSALSGASAILREAAAAIDAEPHEPHRYLALRVRAIVETAANRTMEACGRALGAAPFCRDAAFARRMADLPVFLRQSHAERDLAELGKHVATATGNWLL